MFVPPCSLCSIQVTESLGRPYNDVVALEEPDHADWMDANRYDFGHDAPDGNPYPGEHDQELHTCGFRAATPIQPSPAQHRVAWHSIALPTFCTGVIMCCEMCVSHTVTDTHPGCSAPLRTFHFRCLIR
jgi:hypothetical protein